MGVDYSVTLVRREDRDGTLEKMLALKAACDAAGVKHPQELEEYFGGKSSCSADYLRREATEIDITSAAESNGQESADEYSDLYEVRLDEINLSDVRAVRFRISC